MRVLLLARYDRLGASSRLRSYQYLPYLKTYGIDVTVAPLLVDGYVRSIYVGKHGDPMATIETYLRRLGYLVKSRSYDLLWIEGELLPWLPAWFESLMAATGVKYVVDYDDAIFHRYDLHRSKMVRALLGRKIDTIMRRAETVIVGNSYLADRAKQAGAKRVEYLPTVVDLARYPEWPPRDRQVFTIGWVGTPVTAGYLEVIRPALAQIGRTVDVRLAIVGARAIEFEGVETEARAWSEETEAADIREFDVGIMPLQDTLWERGKCGYKLIQYMACARPVVASPVGVNSTIVDAGENGFLATTTDDWVRALRALHDDRELRLRMGTAGRLKVEKHYCTQVTTSRLASLLCESVQLPGSRAPS